LFRRLPKLGIFRINRERHRPINMNEVMYAIHKGRIDTSKTITIRDLYLAGLFHTAKYGVKLLAKGAEKIDRPLNFEVSDASATLIKIIKEKRRFSCLQI